MADFVFTLRNVRKRLGDKVVLDNVTLVVPARRQDRRRRAERHRQVDAAQDHGRARAAQQRRRHQGPGCRRRHPAAGAAADRGQDGARERPGGGRRDPGAQARASTRSPRRWPTPTPTTTRCWARWATCRPRSTTPTRGISKPGSSRRWTRCAVRPVTRPSTTSPGESAGGWRCASCCSSSRTCCCSTSPPTISTPRACSGSSSTWRVPGRGARRHPRPLLPRQRRRVDPRARPRPYVPLRGQLLHLSGDQAAAARRSRAARTPSGSASSSSELEWVRSNPKARQAKSRARLQRYEELASEAERGPQARLRGDQHPAGPAARRRRDGGP